MTAFARQPNGERTVLLRPRDAMLALRRLDEWNALLDGAAVLLGAEELAEKHWVEMLREQPWTFLGFLDDTTKRVLGHDEKDLGGVQAGDLHIFEKKFNDWRRHGSEDSSSAG